MASTWLICGRADSWRLLEHGAAVTIGPCKLLKSRASMCLPDTDVTISAIYKCHRHSDWGRAAGGREAPGVAQRPTDARNANGRTPSLLRGEIKRTREP
jgi:hypothetical protein